MANNIVSSCAYGYSAVPFYTLVLIKKEKPGPGLITYRIITTFWVRVMSIVSGLILIKSVLQIRNFFKEHNATEFVNTNMLLRHGAAFGLYLVCTIVTAISLMLVNIYSENQKIYNIFSICFIADFLGEFVSQVLLCQVFWEWGKEEPQWNYKQETNNAINDEKDDGIDAKIWNTLVDDRLTFRL